MSKDEAVIIKDTHRALWYEDGVLVHVLEAGRHELPKSSLWDRLMGQLGLGTRKPEIDITQVDMRERDLTIKGQEILTSDKVAIRVSIIVRFRVIDPVTAVHNVDNYSDRIYTDVQLAARRSLASMTLEDILTARNQLSEDILSDVAESGSRYGVEIVRADVKDLIFPGNLQQIMNRVLTAERVAEAQLIETRASAEREQIEAEKRANSMRVQQRAIDEVTRQEALAKAEAQRIETEAEVKALQERAKAAEAYSDHPALLRQMELEALRDLARNSNARIYVNFDKDKAENENLSN